MKKFNNAVVWIFVLLVECFWYCGTGNASSYDMSVFGVPSLQSSSTKTYKLEDGIIKKEESFIVNYCYPINLNNSFEKYVTVRTMVTYLEESSGQAVAFVSVESNFRFNSLMRKAQCLSTSQESVISCSAGSLNVFVRRANVSVDQGQSIFNLKFDVRGKTYDESNRKISCDFIGNIVYN